MSSSMVVGWWWSTNEENENERLREISSMCVCMCLSNDYISILHYQHFLIVFTTSLHASPTATIPTSIVDVTIISDDDDG